MAGSRYRGVAEALRAAGLATEPAVFRGTDEDDLKDEPGDMEDRRHQGDEAPDAHDVRAAMHAVLSRLTPDKRDVLLLRFDREFTAPRGLRLVTMKHAAVRLVLELAKLFTSIDEQLLQQESAGLRTLGRRVRPSM